MSHFLASALAVILNNFWIALLLAVTAATLFRCQRTNAATRHLLWWMVLALVILLPLRGLVRDSRRVAPAISRHVPMPVVVERAVFQPAPPPPRGKFLLRLPGGRWILPVALAWSLFALLQLARIAWSFFYLARVKGRAHAAPPSLQASFETWCETCSLRRPARLLISTEITCPMAVGFFHPAVIVPANLLDEFDARALDHVLLHELAHLSRRDDWSNLAARFVTAFAGLHPVAAWVLRQIGRERELSCDDWVVAATGEAQPYAASLARLFEVCRARRRLVLAPAMASHASQLGQRIETLLARGRQFTAHASGLRIALGACLFLLIAAAGTRAPQMVAMAQSPSASRFSSPAPAPQPQRPAANHKSLLAALVSTGYGDLPVDEIIALKEHGVTADYLYALSDAGFTNLAPADIITAHEHGVNPATLLAAAEFHPHLTLAQIVRLKEAGVLR